MIGLVGLDSTPFDRLGIETRVYSDVRWDAPGDGFAFDIDASATLRQSCDFVDGIASRVGAIDTVAFQPMGTSRMTVGFAALPGVLGRVMDARFGVHSGRGERTAVVVGSGAAASCAIAALVQHEYRRIIVASPMPGLALSAAHRMEVEVETKHADALEGIDIDLLVQTADEHPALLPLAVVDMSGVWADFDGPYVSAQDITARQRQDQIRVLTGRHVELGQIFAAL